FDRQPADPLHRAGDCIRHRRFNRVELCGHQAHAAPSDLAGTSSAAILSICVSRSASTSPCPAQMRHPPAVIVLSSIKFTCSKLGHCILSCGSTLESVSRCDG